MEELRVRANQVGFAALAWGEPGAPLALCLHGYPDTAWTWRHLGPSLAQRGWRVVAPFTRGYGPTDLAADDDYSVPALAADAVALHAALGGDERAALIGHDWGAATAYSVPPGIFARTVTMAVPPTATLLKPPPRLAARQLRRSWYMGLNQLPGVAEGAQARLAPRLWAAWSPGYDAREDLAHLRESWRGPGRARAAVRYYRALRQIRPRDLPEPRVPGLYLHGAADGCVLADVARRAPSVEIVDGAGHFLHLERPDFVNERIAGYIAPS